MTPRYAFAADIGGTKILCALVNDQGDIVARHTSASDALLGPKAILARLHAGWQTLTAAGGLTPCGVGISTAGVVDSATARVIYAGDTMPGWTGMDFRSALASLRLPVLADNDVNAALIGEIWHSPSPWQGLTAMVTLGTGLGGALAVDGQVMAGAHQVAGHIGHQRVWNPYTRCFTILEHIVSGSGLCNIDHALRGKGERRDGPHILAAMDAGDVIARQALHEWIGHLATALHNLYWLLDPARIIIGGGMIHSQERWWGELTAALRDLATPTLLIPARLGNDAGVIGAARLVFDHVDREENAA
jgi:glucokinase